MKPDVSVIVPIYNVAGYLEQCLDSLVNQSHKNIEIICIDDGSTDKSGEIIDAYAAKDKRVKAIHQPNAGVSAARNKGLETARGEYISFVDGDDWIETNAYQTILAEIGANRPDMALFRWSGINCFGGILSTSITFAFCPMFRLAKTVCLMLRVMRQRPRPLFIRWTAVFIFIGNFAKVPQWTRLTGLRFVKSNGRLVKAPLFMRPCRRKGK